MAICRFRYALAPARARCRPGVAPLQGAGRRGPRAHRRAAHARRAVRVSPRGGARPIAAERLAPPGDAALGRRGRVAPRRQLGLLPPGAASRRRLPPPAARALRRVRAPRDLTARRRAPDQVEGPALVPLTLGRRAAAEALGTALLLATVVGSGIMGERLCGGNVAVALLANTLATGAGLVALLLTFGPISGAHFNPAVTLAAATQGGLPWRDVPSYVGAQLGGAFAGVATAHAMFGEPVFSASQHVRSGVAQGASELVATFGLLATIW